MRADARARAKAAGSACGSSGCAGALGAGARRGATAASDRLQSGRDGGRAECARRCAARPAAPAAHVLTSRQCISNRRAREARRVMRGGGSNLAENQAFVQASRAVALRVDGHRFVAGSLQLSHDGAVHLGLERSRQIFAGHFHPRQRVVVTTRHTRNPSACRASSPRSICRSFSGVTS